VQRLFHVSDAGSFASMDPRPSPPGTASEGRPLVWAVDWKHLPNYLLPRQCPRVCWATPTGGHPLLGSPAGRVVAVEHAWADTLAHAGLVVHELDPEGFSLLDPAAGYWGSERTTSVQRTYQVEDCVAALAERSVELRLTPTLWPYLDAVVAGSVEFSAIRMRNARRR
jgi:hypothetical protein